MFTRLDSALLDVGVGVSTGVGVVVDMAIGHVTWRLIVVVAVMWVDMEVVAVVLM